MLPFPLRYCFMLLSIRGQRGGVIKILRRNNEWIPGADVSSPFVAVTKSWLCLSPFVSLVLDGVSPSAASFPRSAFESPPTFVLRPLQPLLLYVLLRRKWQTSLELKCPFLLPLSLICFCYFIEKSPCGHFSLSADCTCPTQLKPEELGIILAILALV